MLKIHSENAAFLRPVSVKEGDRIQLQVANSTTKVFRGPEICHYDRWKKAVSLKQKCTQEFCLKRMIGKGDHLTVQ
jgi:hypothetical protein